MSRIGRVSKGAVAGLVFLLGIVSIGQTLAQQPVFRNRVLLEDGSAFNAGAQDIRFEGASAKREMGSAIVFGDFDGDGIQDLAVGERKNNRVYIYFGRTVLDPNNANATDPNGAYIVRPVASGTNDAPDVTITCSGCQLDPNNNSDFGFSLAAGDVTDDSVAELIIGAPFDDAGNAATDRGTDRGRAFIIDGRPRGSWPASLDADTGAGTHRITASAASNTKKYYLGFAVAVGDFTDDGVGDIAISSRGANFPLYAATPGAKSAGAVHLIPDTSIGGNIDVSTTAGVKHIVGDAANDFFGESLAFCNLDGPGNGQDLLVGAIGVDNTSAQPNAGAMFIYKGATLTAATATKASPLRGLANSDSRILGADKDDSLGFTVACGDIDGDGFDDALVSAFFAAGIRNRKPGAGEVFAFYGQPTIPDPNFPAAINLRVDGDPNNPANLPDGIPDAAQLWIIGSTQGD